MGGHLSGSLWPAGMLGKSELPVGGGFLRKGLQCAWQGLPQPGTRCGSLLCWAIAGGTAAEAWVPLGKKALTQLCRG